MLIEELRQAHCDRWNENKTPDPFQVGYIFKSHIQVHSNAIIGVLQKLSYQEQFQFRIIKDCGYNLYDNANGLVQLYKGTNLYLLLLHIDIYNKEIFIPASKVYVVPQENRSIVKPQQGNM